MLEKTLLLVSIIDQIRQTNCFVKVHISYRGNDCDAFVKYSVCDSNTSVKNELKIGSTLFNKLITRDIEEIKFKFLRK